MIRPTRTPQSELADFTQAAPLESFCARRERDRRYWIACEVSKDCTTHKIAHDLIIDDFGNLVKVPA